MAPLFLTSRLLSVVHGFSVRSGGVSLPPRDALNLGFHVGDEPAAVAENLRRLEKGAGIAPGALHTISQVHGDRVLEAPPTLRRGEEDCGEADALISRHDGIAVGVRTADCVPVLIEAERGAVAAVHAGWRGTEAEILTRTIERLAEAGADVSRLKVAIGPAIGACCYGVSAELAARFGEKFGAAVVQGPPDAPRLDLIAALKVSLTRAGVADSQVDVVAACTSCDAQRFFSHRRDRGATGRHLSFIRCARGPNS